MNVNDIALEARREATISRIKDLYRRIANNSLLAQDIVDAKDVEFTDLSGFMTRIHADPDEFEQHFSAFAETYDIFRGFEPSNVILDVGAHWGYSALAMRRRGAMAKIFSIEAMPYNTRGLSALREAEKGRYDFIQCAATESTEELVFYIPVMNGVANTGSASTGGTLSDRFAFILADLVISNPAKDGELDAAKVVVEKVHGYSIDEIAARHDLSDKIVAIKMDAEGHEGSALRGARKLLRERRPLLMVEGANTDTEVVREMQDAGYYHCERHIGRLVRHDARSEAIDGFWVHPDHEEEYRSFGIL